MKKILAILFAMILCVSALGFAVSAEEGEKLLVVDAAELLTENEEGKLVKQLEELRDAYDVEVAIITVGGLDGADAADVVEALYKELGYGVGDEESGVLLLISSDGDDRDWSVHVHGVGEEAIGDSEMDSIMDSVLPHLSKDNFYDGFTTFADECDYYINGYINGFPFEFGMNFVIALVVGLIVAAIATSIMKGKLKSVRFQNQAADYVKAGSMNVTLSRDFYLYRTVTRTAKPKDDSGSSGRSSSGGGRTYSGKF